MKKTGVLIASGILLIGSYSLMANTSLNNGVNDLQLKLQRVQKINTLEKTAKEQQGQIDTLTKQFKDTSIQLSVANEKIKAEQVQINSLQSNNDTLRKLKAQLEEESIATQNILTSSYNEKINNIQAKNKSNLDAFLDKSGANKKKFTGRNKQPIAKDYRTE